MARIVQRQAFDDLGARWRIGGGGECDARHCGKAFVQHRQFAVLGAEIVAPLRYAVRLVDGKQRQPGTGLHLFEQGEEAWHQQALRRNVQQIPFAARHAAQHFARRIGIKAGVVVRRLNTKLHQCFNLILHQRNEWRNDDAHAAPQQRRNLVAQRFSAPGRHQHQRVAAPRHMRDDILLRTTVGGIAENIMQELGSGGHIINFKSENQKV